MMRKTIILFDSFTIRDEAVQYSIELARRTDSDLIFLMLLASETGDNDPKGSDVFEKLKTQVSEALGKHMEQAEQAGVSVGAVVRSGDPQSELMKFLAGASSIQTIVWGGMRDLPDKGSNQKKAHWLVKAKDLVECPVVVPSMKP